MRRAEELAVTPDPLRVRKSSVSVGKDSPLEKERFSPDSAKVVAEDGGDPGKSVLAVGLMTQNQIVSLESVTRLFSELQTERNWIEKEMDKVFREKVQLTTELKDVDRAIEELRQRKADLDGRLQKTTLAEKELRAKMERVDQKVASIGEESARFERSIRHITVPEPPGGAPDKGSQGSTDSSGKTLRGHCDAVTGLDIDLQQGIAVSGSADKSIRLWSLANGACVQTVWGHTGAVRCVALKGGRLLSGAQDHSLRLWNASNGRCISILRGHTGPVSCAQLDDARIVSGGFDRNLNVWDPDLGLSLSVLTGHADAVQTLQFWDFGLASGSADRTVRMWDLRTGACHRTLEAHQGGVTTLQFDTTKLITGGGDSTVKVWDLRMGEALHVLPFRAAVTALSFDANSLAVAAADASLKIFDSTGYQTKRVLTGHQGSVVSVKLQDGQLLTGATDNVIKVWQL